VKLGGSFNTYRDKGFDHELDVGVASLGGRNFVRDFDDDPFAREIRPSDDGRRLEYGAPRPDRFEGRMVLRA
jgi:hypothetical protein